MLGLCLFAALLCVFPHGSSQEGQTCFPADWLESVVMSVKLHNTGFHRDLHYRVQHGEAGGAVRVLLLQQMPSGVYMDRYQLSSLQQDTGLEVLLDSELDVEAPEYSSSGFSALVFLAPPPGSAGVLEAVVPLHARYHRPSPALWVTVEIPPPRLLLLPAHECDRTGLKHELVDAPCTVTNQSRCAWLEIHSSAESEPLRLDIPVGDSSMTTTVCVCTVSVTMLSCVYLIKIMWKYGTF